MSSAGRPRKFRYNLRKSLCACALGVDAQFQGNNSEGCKEIRWGRWYIFELSQFLKRT